MYILFCYYQHQEGYVFGQVDFRDDPEHNPDLGSGL